METIHARELLALKNAYMTSCNEAQNKLRFKSMRQVYAQTVLCCDFACDEELKLLPELAYSLRQLWRDRSVRAAAKRGFEYELNDSAL